MYTKFIFIIITLIALISIMHTFLITRRIKKQITHILNVLADIKQGNGNRRILAKTNDFLSPLVYELNDIIISYENKLAIFRQTDEANNELMTNLSHDIRTPLTTLIGYLDAIHRGIVTENERDNYIEIARQKSHDLKEYIDLLFDWCKLNSGEFTIEVNVSEIGELTRNILADWIPIFENKQLDYTIEISEQPFWVKLDENAYLRILNNLIQNILAHSHADKIDISLLQQNDLIEINLSDNGVGVDKEDLNHIFERLYKCDKGRSEKGSGLGLFIVHQLVEKMGGNIIVESTLGTGTTFTLHFPLANKNDISYHTI